MCQNNNPARISLNCRASRQRFCGRGFSHESGHCPTHDMLKFDRLNATSDSNPERHAKDGLLQRYWRDQQAREQPKILTISLTGSDLRSIFPTPGSAASK